MLRTVALFLSVAWLLAGFSAGGHLVAAMSTHFDKRIYPPIDAADKESCRPDFAVSIYPGHLSIHAAEWDAQSQALVEEGNRNKFDPEQNPELAHYLLSTHPRLLVEASPHDRIW